MKKAVSLFLVTVFLIGAALLWIVINYSVIESRYGCVGHIQNDAGAKPSEAYLKLRQYRWWVGLWSDSKGSVWLEMPHFYSTYYNKLGIAGDILIFTGAMDASSGTLSALSGAVAIRIPGGRGDYIGKCKLID